MLESQLRLQMLAQSPFRLLHSKHLMHRAMLTQDRSCSEGRSLHSLLIDASRVSGHHEQKSGPLPICQIWTKHFAQSNSDRPPNKAPSFLQLLCQVGTSTGSTYDAEIRRHSAEQMVEGLLSMCGWKSSNRGADRAEWSGSFF